VATGFRLADPTEYRRGVILGLTLAEVLMLLVFLLLLSSSAIMARRAKETAALRASFSKYNSLLAPILERAASSGIDVKDTDELVSLIVRGQQAEALKQELDRRTSELAAARSAAERAARERDDIKSRMSQGDRELIAKASEDDALRAMLKRVPAAGADAPESLRQILDQSAKTTAADLNLTGQNAQMRNELARMKGNGGSGLPYCWTTIDGHPIYMLRVVLHDSDIVIQDLEPRARPEDDAWKMLSGVPRGTPIQMSDFLSATGALQSAAASAKCRYAVIAFDGTAPTNKRGYKFLMGRLWSAFMVHEVNK
jgi:hypothetical protein